MFCTGYKVDQAKRKAIDAPMMKSEVFFRTFPFHIVFGRDMLVRHVGAGLRALLPELINRRLDHAFELCMPPIEFSYENVSYMYMYIYISKELALITNIWYIYII